MGVLLCLLLPYTTCTALSLAHKIIRTGRAAAASGVLWLLRNLINRFFGREREREGADGLVHGGFPGFWVG